MPSDGNKAAWRRAYLAAAKANRTVWSESPSNYQELTEKLTGRLLSLVQEITFDSRGAAITGYIPEVGEPNVLDTLQLWRVMGGRALLPHVARDTAWSAVSQPQWVSMGMRARVVEHLQPAVILLPGVVFDAAGTRLGRGAGWYDKALKFLPSATRVGVAFDSQVTPGRSVPRDSHDMPVNYLVTPSKTLKIFR